MVTLKEIEEAAEEQSTSLGNFSSSSGTLEFGLQNFNNLQPRNTSSIQNFNNLQPSNTSSNAMLDSKEQPCGLLPLEWA